MSEHIESSPVDTYDAASHEAPEAPAVEVATDVAAPTAEAVPTPSETVSMDTLARDHILGAIHQWFFDHIYNSPVSANTEALNHLRSELLLLPGYIMKGAE